MQRQWEQGRRKGWEKKSSGLVTEELQKICGLSPGLFGRVLSTGLQENASGPNGQSVRSYAL